MEEAFGADAPLSVSRGKTHDYLGMSLDFRTKGEVQIDMEHYINMMLQDAPKDMEGVSNMPAAAHLFKTNSEDPKMLDDKQKKIFVHLVIVENSNTRLLLISCSQGILSSSSFSCCLLLRLLVYMYLSQLMRTFTNYLKCIVISS